MMGVRYMSDMIVIEPIEHVCPVATHGQVASSIQCSTRGSSIKPAPCRWVSSTCIYVSAFRRDMEHIHKELGMSWLKLLTEPHQELRNSLELQVNTNNHATKACVTTSNAKIIQLMLNSRTLKRRTHQQRHLPAEVLPLRTGKWHHQTVGIADKGESIWWRLKESHNFMRKLRQDIHDEDGHNTSQSITIKPQSVGS